MTLHQLCAAIDIEPPPPRRQAFIGELRCHLALVVAADTADEDATRDRLEERDGACEWLRWMVGVAAEREVRLARVGDDLRRTPRCGRAPRRCRRALRAARSGPGDDGPPAPRRDGGGR